MPTNRFQFSDDFVLNNGNVGINSSSPQEKLDVVGVVKGQDLKVTGVSSFTTYEGFLNSNQNISENVDLTSGTSGSLSGEIIVGTGVTVTVGSAATSSQGNIDSLKVYNTFTVPTGGTEDRPIKVKPGQLYYNVDFKTIEFWDGNVWRQVDNTTRSGRGVFGGGWAGTLGQNKTRLDYIQIHTLGNSIFFGDLTLGRRNPGGRVSSSIRGVMHGGYDDNPTNTDRIDYFTIASGGTAADFGNLLGNTHAIANGALSSSTRGIIGGGSSPAQQNVIQYIEISTTGDALDFGDLTDSINNAQAVASPTRGLFCGGQSPGAVNLSTIQAITISSKGDAIDIGDLTQPVLYGGCVTSGTRGVIAGGEYVPSPAFGSTSTMELITIASTGNASDFGDLTTVRSRIASMETITRGVFAGSVADGSSNTFTNVIDYINIASTGNAQDFGDIANGGIYQVVGCSDSHGGLGGF